MIIILNGSIGVGKTSVSWKLNELLQPSIMLDGDYIGAVSPFEIYDEKRTEYLYQTMAHLIAFHLENGYEHFIINYVFENQKELDALIQKLENLELKVFCFWLTCNEKEQRQRILNRNNDQVEWELKRGVELNQILEDTARRMFIGKRIETSISSIDEISSLILKELL